MLDTGSCICVLHSSHSLSLTANDVCIGFRRNPKNITRFRLKPRILEGNFNRKVYPNPFRNPEVLLHNQNYFGASHRLLYASKSRHSAPAGADIPGRFPVTGVAGVVLNCTPCISAAWRYASFIWWRRHGHLVSFSPLFRHLASDIEVQCHFCVTTYCSLSCAPGAQLRHDFRTWILT